MKKDVQKAGRCFEEAERLLMEGVYLKAIRQFTKAISINPRFAEALYNRALAYYFLKDFKSAIPDLTAAIESNPLYKDAYMQRGICYFSLSG